MPASLSVEDVKEILMNEDDEFARIYRKHRELDEKVTALEELHHLTPEEEIQEKQLKKDKLRLKDQMAEMIKDYQASR